CRRDVRDGNDACRTTRGVHRTPPASYAPYPNTEARFTNPLWGWSWWEIGGVYQGVRGNCSRAPNARWTWWDCGPLGRRLRLIDASLDGRLMPTCRELRDIPPLEPNCSFQLCMCVEDRGFIVYEANPF